MIATLQELKKGQPPSPMRDDMGLTKAALACRQPLCSVGRLVDSGSRSTWVGITLPCPLHTQLRTDSGSLASCPPTPHHTASRPLFSQTASLGATDSAAESARDTGRNANYHRLHFGRPARALHPVQPNELREPLLHLPVPHRLTSCLLQMLPNTPHPSTVHIHITATTATTTQAPARPHTMSSLLGALV